MRPLVAHCHLGLGKLSRGAGQHERAQEHLTTAATMYREMRLASTTSPRRTTATGLLSIEEGPDLGVANLPLG
jgi:hypothetical protein